MRVSNFAILLAGFLRIPMLVSHLPLLLCAPLVADLFLFCYERDFMLFLSDNNQTDINEAFNSTS